MFVCILFLMILICYRNVVEGYTAPPKVYLVGDSIFDNRNYVPDGKDVFSYIREMNPRTVMIARDNATIDDVYAQLKTVNITDNDTLFISVGGNDILNDSSNLDEIKRRYMKLLSHIKKGNIVLCDVYYPPQMKHYHKIIRQWNDFIHSFDKEYVIKKISISMNHPQLFTDIIEPSELGSVVIADTICPNRVCIRQ